MKGATIGMLIGGMLLAVVAGGLISRWVFSTDAAEAQSNAVTAEVVTTRALRVVDASNRSRIFATTIDSLGGAPGLSMSDTDGRIRTFLGVTDSGNPFVSLDDQNGESRLVLWTEGDGLPGIFLYDGRGMMRATLRTLDDGTTGIAFLDDSQRLRAVLQIARDGSPGIFFFDQDGRPIVTSVDSGALSDLGALTHAALDGSGLRGAIQVLRQADELQRQSDGR